MIEDPRQPRVRLTVCAIVVAVSIVMPVSRSIVATSSSTLPEVKLSPAAMMRFVGDVDSNSPALWDLVDGQRLLHVLTSTAGQPSIASGRILARLGDAAAVGFVTHPGHGVWMEAVVADDAGTWYGYYHNEIPATLCNRSDRTLPRIGAARSRDRGQTWEDLGIILEAPAGWESCNTRNGYFVGGVGDLSVMLDADATDLYLFFSQYSRPRQAQGVAVARLLWGDRDRPRGGVNVWADGIWQPTIAQPSDPDDPESEVRFIYPAGRPLVSVARPWHDADSSNDAYWGPSVHWNGHLEQYVMLLNRTKDDHWDGQGRGQIRTALRRRNITALHRVSATERPLGSS